MKKIFLLFLVFALVLSATACGGTPAASSPSSSSQASNSQTSGNATQSISGTVTYLTMVEYHDANTLIVEAFEKAYPGVKVEMEEYPFAQLFDVIEIKLGSQSSNFDVILTDATMVAGYAYRGFTAPMDNDFTQDEKAQFAEALVNSSTYAGKFYSPPIKNSCHVLWYNKKLLDKAGVAYPSSDPAQRMTWEELVPIAQKVMEAANDPTVFGLTFEQISRPYQILPLPNSLGAEGIGPDGTTVDGYINSDKYVKAMQWYSDIHNVYNIAPKGVSATETVGLFTAGKIAFMSANIFDYKAFEKTEGLEYGYAPLPYFADGKPVTPTDSFHVSVSNYSKNKEAAAAFVKFLTLGEGNDIFMEKQGDFPARKELLNAYESDAKYNDFPLSVFKLAAYEANTTAFPRPLSLGYREWEGVMESTNEDIRNGADVKEALDAAVKSIEVLMVPYK